MAVNINVPSQVKTYANLAAFPATGALKTIYIAEDTNKTYRWTGSVYVEVSASASGITIGSTAIASGVVGRVLFEGAGNVVQESSSLFWDATNNRLGIGTSTPSHKLAVYESNSSENVSARFETANANLNYIYLKSAHSANHFIQTNASGIIISADENGTNGYFRIKTNNINALSVTNTQNVLIGTTTDAGFKLDVVGNSRISGNLRFLNTSDTLEFANTLVRIRRVANGMYLDAFNGFTFFDSTSSLDRVRITQGGNVLINTTTDAGFRLDVNGTARINTLTIGLGAGQVSTNTVVGATALNTNTTGSENTAVGFDALRANTTGQSNAAVGRNSMTSNTTGSNNAAFGRFSLRNNTTGVGNTAIGNAAQDSNTTGNFNIGIGSSAMSANTTGSNNVVIGVLSSTGNFDSSIILGREATATASNQFVVGSSAYNAGSVTSEVNTSTQVWNVIINGVPRKILLA